MGGALRILVIDDDHDLRIELVELLRTLAFEVDGCASAKEAQGLIGERDLLLCDLDLGAESGIELIRSIQSAALPRPSIIAISGRIDLINLCADWRGIPLLPKPTKVSTLVEAIRAVEHLPRATASSKPPAGWAS